MHCCKIGCGNPPVKIQEIAYLTENGYIIRHKIKFCEEHAPKHIFEEFEPLELLRDRGASY